MHTNGASERRPLRNAILAAAVGAGLAAGALWMAGGGSPAAAQGPSAGGGFTLSVQQLRINQRISSAAVRRSNESLQLLDPIRPVQSQPAKVLGWGTANLVDGAVTGPKIGDGSVGESKIGDGAVTGSKIGAGAVGTEKLSPGTHGVALAGVKVVGGNPVSWFNRFGGEPTVQTTATGVRLITFPGLEGRLGGNNAIHVATLRGAAPGLINARNVAGNPEVRTWNISGAGANSLQNRGFNYTVFGTTTGPTP